MHVRGWGNALSRRREKKVSSWSMEQQGEEEREKPLENSFLDLVTDQIMPSKMDVAPWDKHRIKREFEGFGLYSMVFVKIQ